MCCVCAHAPFRVRNDHAVGVTVWALADELVHSLLSVSPHNVDRIKRFVLAVFE